MRKLVLIALMLLMPAFIFAQDTKPADRHVFTKVYDVKTTTVKNQGGTGTCWDFATTSFLETELLRMGKGEFDLSEMFFARNAYISKAVELVRFSGKNNFGQGGQAHDVIDVLRTKGCVPDEVYSGLPNGEKMHNHSEMEQYLSLIVNSVATPKPSGNPQMPQRKPSQRWIDVANAIMDVYIGKVPETFTYKGKEYTPKSFAKELGLNPDDYIEITSFSLFPFYTKGHIPVPDNWSHGHYYNLPLDDVMAVMENAVKKGYSVDWDGDVSEKGFKSKDGYAVVPEDAKDEDATKPEKEKVITDDMHLASFNDQTTTDDHLMHITGMATDQNGTKFWLTKNSWGPVGKYNGYLYMSDAYTRYKMIAIMVHKDAIPKDIREKLKID
jgi:bleomycin hydrolase